MHQSRYIPPLEYILIRNVRFVCFNIVVSTAHKTGVRTSPICLLLFLFVWLGVMDTGLSGNVWGLIFLKKVYKRKKMSQSMEELMEILEERQEKEKELLQNEIKDMMKGLKKSKKRDMEAKVCMKWTL